ncbi:MAG: hypothetical protein ABI862_06745 [Ilumatobacteraceae bacterium]
MLIVHAGNRIDLANRRRQRFPSTQVPAVRARVARLLDALQPSDVVSVAAAGADLIVLEEAIRREINAHVVLPIAVEQFVAQSVVDAGPEWATSFGAVLHHVSTHDGCTVMQGHGDPNDNWYLAAHDQLLRRAEAIAAGRTIVALTIRPPEEEVPPSVTDEFVSRAERIDMLVLTIDPRPGSSTTVTVL